jgi:hypothetical protein
MYIQIQIKIRYSFNLCKSMLNSPVLHVFFQ